MRPYKNSRPQAWMGYKPVIDSCPSPLLRLTIFACALLLTLSNLPFLFNPLPSLLFTSLISCISISQSFSALPEGAMMTSEESLERA